MSTNNKFLIVDDDESIRLTVRTFLELMGAEVVEAVNPTEALVHLTSTEFKGMYTDNDMPEANMGLKLISQAKKIQPNLEIVFMSGDMTVEKQQLGLGAGAKLCTMKPFGLLDYLTKLAKKNKTEQIVQG